MRNSLDGVADRDFAGIYRRRRWQWFICLGCPRNLSCGRAEFGFLELGDVFNRLQRHATKEKPRYP